MAPTPTESADIVIVGAGLAGLQCGARLVEARPRVMNVNYEPIEDLFACGTAALGGIDLGGHGHHLLWAAATGAAAARSIADRL